MSWRHAGQRALVALGTLAFVLVFNFFLFRAVGDPKKDLIRSRLARRARGGDPGTRPRQGQADPVPDLRRGDPPRRPRDVEQQSPAGRRRVDGRAAEHAPPGRHRDRAVVGPRLLDGGGRRRKTGQYHGHVAHAGQPGAGDAVTPHRHPRDLAVRGEAPDLPDRSEEHAGRARPAAPGTTGTCSSTCCCRSPRSPPACSRSSP